MWKANNEQISKREKLVNPVSFRPQLIRELGGGEVSARGIWIDENIRSFSPHHLSLAFLKICSDMEDVSVCLLSVSPAAMVKYLTQTD